MSLNVVLTLNFLFQVETVEGFRDLEIPSGIQHGHSVKLSRLGVPDMNKPSIRGDHYFVVNVLIPKDIRSVFFFLPSLLISYIPQKII
jgi:DnaJ-class molecular chaperone